MRLFIAVLTASLAVQIGTAQSDPGFSGLWKLNPARSNVRSTPVPADPFLKVEQTATALSVSSSAQEGGWSKTSTYPLDGTSRKHQSGSSTMNTVTKWEGSALLVNTIVSGPQNYTVMERWKVSRDGSTLTIKRTIVQLSGESESMLVYENPQITAAAAPAPEPSPAPSTPRMVERPPVPAQPRQASSEAASEYVVTSGTRVLCRLTSAINTKHTAAGDRVYLETAVPVFVNGQLVIPRGSFVNGTVIEAKRAGRVKGKSALDLRFDSITLPNGVTRDLRSRPSAADAQGNLDRKEGRIEGDGDKGGDARTVGQTTAAGAGVGGIAGAATGHLGMGAGIGAAAGAAAGLAKVFGSRGPDVMLPVGTTVEMMLDRDLRYSATEVRAGR